MSDDDKPMDVQLICNQCVVTDNKLRVMNPMGLSAPWEDYKKQLFTNMKIEQTTL